MQKLRKKIYIGAGAYTVSFGSGRKEFNPQKPMPTFENYMRETSNETLSMIDNADFDEGVISNCAAECFIKQAHLGGFLPQYVPSLNHKPCHRVEGACASGGLAVTSAIRSILGDIADSVFVMGLEIQNTMKAVYGADVLSLAGYHSKERKKGHAFFFPGFFSDRAKVYYKNFGYEQTRKAMAKWYEQAIFNARKTPKAQEYHNVDPDPYRTAMVDPNPKTFCEHISVFDCSKVSDGASSLVVASEEGLKKLGLKKEKCIEVLGVGIAASNVAEPPNDPTFLSTTEAAVEKALKMSGIERTDIGVLEIHDCFSITALLMFESAHFVKRGEGGSFIMDGATRPQGILPTNISGGLIGFGHPVGATGVRQVVDVWRVFSGSSDVKISNEKEFGMIINMGGNDKTVVSLVFKRAE